MKASTLKTNLPASPVRIGIAGLDKAAVLQALHAAARLPLIDPPDSALPITQAEATWYIENCQSSGAILYYARIGGRVLKVDITGDALDPTCFDGANGAGAAQAAIDHLRREAVIAGRPWEIQQLRVGW